MDGWGFLRWFNVELNGYRRLLREFVICLGSLSAKMGVKFQLSFSELVFKVRLLRLFGINIEHFFIDDENLSLCRVYSVFRVCSVCRVCNVDLLCGGSGFFSVNGLFGMHGLYSTSFGLLWGSDTLCDNFEWCLLFWFNFSSRCLGFCNMTNGLWCRARRGRTIQYYIVRNLHVIGYRRVIKS